ncbi:hypothetical protein E2C01_087166 [Portunus trituberculatus]|uniref:Uncharacterized protein n=1 Tax=Portunus trituberculatus TaxID=210409 RepID=A0A5B7JIC2_PORTR|nr:hypothetical protein [Portunus trituberculatus]
MQGVVSLEPGCLVACPVRRSEALCLD